MSRNEPKTKTIEEEMESFQSSATSGGVMLFDELENWWKTVKINGPLSNSKTRLVSYIKYYKNWKVYGVFLLVFLLLKDVINDTFIDYIYQSSYDQEDGLRSSLAAYFDEKCGAGTDEYLQSVTTTTRSSLCVGQRLIISNSLLCPKISNCNCVVF